MFAQKVLIRVTGNIIVRLIGFFVGIILARTFGAAGVGKVGYIVSVVGMFGILANFGIAQYFSVKIAAEKDINQYFSAFLFSKLFLLIPFCIAVWIYFYVKPCYEIERAIFIIAFFYLALSTLDEVMNGTIVARQRFFFLSVADIVANCFRVFLFFILYLTYRNLIIIAILMLAHAAARLVAHSMVIRRLNIKLVKPDMRIIRDCIKYTIPIIFLTVIGYAGKYIHKIMVGNILNEEILGFLIVAVTVYSIPDFFVKSLTNTLFPKICKEIKEYNDEKFTEHFQFILDHYAFLGCGLMILVWSFSDIAVWVLYGADFAPVALILKFYSLIIVAKLFFRPFLQVIYAKELHSILATIAPIMFALSICIYIVFMPEGNWYSLGVLSVPIASCVGWILQGTTIIIMKVKRQYRSMKVRQPIFTIIMNIAIIIAAEVIVSHMNMGQLFKGAFRPVILIGVFIVANIISGNITADKISYAQKVFGGLSFAKLKEL